MLPLRDTTPGRVTPWVTWSLVLACAVVFAFQLVQPAWFQRELLLQYGLVPQRITTALATAGDPAVYTTAFTAMFLHGALLHVAGNLWFLRLFGDGLEARLGHVRFAGLYVLWGLLAALIHWALAPHAVVPMVGASGAIAGVLGAYAVFFPRAKIVTWVPFRVWDPVIELPSLVPIALWFVLQFAAGIASFGTRAGAGIAYWAHVGGFVAGVAAGLAIKGYEALRRGAGAGLVPSAGVELP